MVEQSLCIGRILEKTDRKIVDRRENKAEECMIDECLAGIHICAWAAQWYEGDSEMESMI